MLVNLVGMLQTLFNETDFVRGSCNGRSSRRYAIDLNQSCIFQVYRLTNNIHLMNYGKFNHSRNLKIRLQGYVDLRIRYKISKNFRCACLAGGPAPFPPHPPPSPSRRRHSKNRGLDAPRFPKAIFDKSGLLITKHRSISQSWQW